MTTLPADRPSSEAEVQAALLALDHATEHPFSVVLEDGAVVAGWAGATGRERFTYRYVVRLLPETGEYTRLTKTSARTSGSASGSYTFNSLWISKPVNEVLRAHGWRPRRTAVGKFLRRLVGRTD
ncbi:MULTISPECIES: hypothetical protein [unclassified Curtobacterium]|uniref:hypothetical protein n=1 Tax=unclassified Curtobacterium TaxID=257496 RepID=UPI00226B683A|nr:MULTISPECIES: hypothetical protein [unclassified Curtobacterium]